MERSKEEDTDEEQGTGLKRIRKTDLTNTFCHIYTSADVAHYVT